MADLLITEAVSQAEEAIETGNYDGAIETCQRILGQFPEFAAAHRILGEAYAEQGELDEARQAYQRTLERDPQSVAAHVGLGFIAEEANDKKAALAHFQVAWEIDPRRRDLREHVSRLSQEIYGEEGRLYLTRAALTSLHFYAGRWDRAISEAAQVLQEFSSRVDVQVRMAEALWRRGDDEQAMQVCSTILRALPLAIVPLLIQADIYRRQGNDSDAQDLLSQARAIDPAGVRAADLIIVGLDDQAEFLTVEDVPTIDESVLTEEPATRYAPALDFTAEDESGTETFVPTEEPAGEISDEAPLAGEAVPEAPVSEPENLQPFSWDEIGDEDLEASDLDEAELPTDEQDEIEVEPEEDVAGAVDEEVNFELYTDEEIDQARPTDEHPAGFTGYLTSLDSEGMQPFDPEATEDDDVAPTLSGPEPEPVAEEPSEVSDEADETWAAFEQEVESAPETVEAEEPAAEQPTDDPLDLDWDQVDEEIQDAIPGDIPHGYTDELRTLDSTGVEPFAFDDTPAEDVIPDEIFEEETGDEQVDLSELESPAEEEAEGKGEAGEEPEMDFDELTRDWERAETSEVDAAAFEPEPQDLESVEELFGDFEGDSRRETDEGHETTELEPFEELSTVEESVAEHVEEQPIAEFEPTETYIPGQPGDEPVSDVRAAAERLGLREDVIERARAAKAELVSQGRIGGTDRLPGLGPSLEDLEAAVDEDPDNVDHRIALAAALVDVDTERALDQFRWLYRNAGDRGRDFLGDLIRLIESTQEQEVRAHRLLAAIYRRHGDWLAAATHYEESLLVNRR